MAYINYAARQISVKIVYYGPGLSGKTTNLRVIHDKTPPGCRGDMASIATETDRTLFFDFLPLDLGKIKGLETTFQLFTVPGQVYYNATRKLVLRGADGVVFVADSCADKLVNNLESFQNLEDNLTECDIRHGSIPIIIQYNKRDLPDALSVETLNRQINKYDLPYSESIACTGDGVFETLKQISKMVMDHLNKKYSNDSGQEQEMQAQIDVQALIQAAQSRPNPNDIDIEAELDSFEAELANSVARRNDKSVYRQDGNAAPLITATKNMAGRRDFANPPINPQMIARQQQQQGFLSKFFSKNQNM